ncbi:MAG: 50S ribosomal protein L3 [Chloroflexi bacterium]|nr:50S ribosomal protein L3 [Chloroflexota bacterium]
MMDAILARKLGMTQIFSSAGEVVPVSMLEAGPCYITALRTPQGNGYAAVQLGFGESTRLNKAQKGHLGSKLPSLRHLREVRVADTSGYEIGQKIEANIFSLGDAVKVTAISKGRGFAGVVKRHGFRGGPKTHGQSDRHRAPGSIGSTTTPGRVLKGLRMAGHMGNARVTVRNLKVVLVDAENNLLGVKGSVPGSPGGLVLVQRIPQKKSKEGKQQ